MNLGFEIKKRYRVIYTPNEGVQAPSFDASLKLYNLYTKSFPDSLKCRIWVDLKKKIYFSQNQYRQTIAGKDHHFSIGKQNFSKSPWGLSFCSKTVDRWPSVKDQKKIINDDIIFGEHPKIHKFKNKSVLIIGGGPSVDSVNWQNIECDHIATCNQFYLNKKVASKKVDIVAMISGLVDFSEDEQFKNYIYENDTLVSLEAECGHLVVDSHLYDKAREFCKNNPKISTFFHTRYRGQPGIGLRLIVYCIFMGFKDIYFVGIDGRSNKETDGNLLHAFEKNKPIPGWYKKFGDGFQERQFIVFWDYIMSLKEEYNFNIYNLGEDSKYNILSKMFKNEYPLPGSIKEKLYDK